MKIKYNALFFSFFKVDLIFFLCKKKTVIKIIKLDKLMEIL